MILVDFVSQGESIKTATLPVLPDVGDSITFAPNGTYVSYGYKVVHKQFILSGSGLKCDIFVVRY